MKKEKEKIRTQITKSLTVYKGETGFEFFDSSNSISKPDTVLLDENDLEVLLMNLNDFSWILLTTKCLFIRQYDLETRIDIVDINKFEFLNREKGKEDSASFKNLGEYKSRVDSGDFRIVRNDGTEVMVNLPHHNFGFCLVKAIKKLRFVTNKYEGT